MRKEATFFIKKKTNKQKSYRRLTLRTECGVGSMKGKEGFSWKKISLPLTVNRAPCLQQEAPLSAAP